MMLRSVHTWRRGCSSTRMGWYPPHSSDSSLGLGRCTDFVDPPAGTTAADLADKLQIRIRWEDDKWYPAIIQRKFAEGKFNLQFPAQGKTPESFAKGVPLFPLGGKGVFKFRVSPDTAAQLTFLRGSDYIPELTSSVRTPNIFFVTFCLEHLRYCPACSSRTPSCRRILHERVLQRTFSATTRARLSSY
jgi:hypothetical protein